MHIVYVSWEYPPAYGGGIGTFVRAVGQGMAHRGHRVTVITSTDKPYPMRELDGDVEVLRIRHNSRSGPEPMGSLSSWQARSDATAVILARMIDAGGVDVIEFGDYRGEGVSFLSGTCPDQRPVSLVRLHTSLVVLNKYNPSNPRYRVLEEYENQAIHAADRVVSPSQALVREMREGVPGLGQMLISPHPVDLRFLDYEPATAVPERDEILYVGRLEERKGVETLARAAAGFFAKVPDTRLVMIGGDAGAGRRNPSMRQVILDLVPRTFHDRIEFAGVMPREDLILRYLQAKFCVFPSHFENFPNTCLEAMCLGRCVIGTDNSGMAEMIQSGENGLIVRAADPNELADAMHRLHAMPEDRRRRMGQAAKQRMAERYHPEIIASEMEQLYGEFVAEHACPPKLSSISKTAEARVSFIIPCYNHGKYLPEAIKSAKNQSYQYIDCVVVDDGSTDEETIAALRQAEADGVRVIRQPNQGLSAARNTGIRATETPFYIALDADDKVAPDFVEKLLVPMQADSCLGYCYSHVNFFGAASGIWQCADYDPRRLLVENLSVATALVRRAAYDLVNGYSRDMVHGFEDWDFWLSLLSVGYHGRCVPEPLFFYRKHPPGKSMLEETQKHRAEMISVMIEHHRELFASMLSVSLSDKDAMFFKSHMEAWHLREAASQTRQVAALSSDGQATGSGNLKIYQALMAQAEIDYIEASQSWQRILRFKRSWPYRTLASLRFGSAWDQIPPDEGPVERLARIKTSRLYRLLVALKRTRLFLWYARRKHGPDFIPPFTNVPSPGSS